MKFYQMILFIFIHLFIYLLQLGWYPVAVEEYQNIAKQIMNSPFYKIQQVPSRLDWLFAPCKNTLYSHAGWMKKQANTSTRICK